MNFLYKYDLRLLYPGKWLLAKNYYFKINNFLQKHHIPLKHTPELDKCSSNKENKKLSETECFRKIRKEYFKNPVMGYLNINSLRNEIIGLREI